MHWLVWFCPRFTSSVCKYTIYFNFPWSSFFMTLCTFWQNRHAWLVTSEEEAGEVDGLFPEHRLAS